MENQDASLNENWVNILTEEESDDIDIDPAEVSRMVGDGNDDPSLTTTASKKRKKALTSKWWEYFDLLPAVANDTRRWSQCKKCKKKYQYKSGNGTNTMKKHAESCQRRSGITQPEPGQSQIVGPHGELSHMVRPVFDTTVFRELLAMCVIKHDLPFQFTEWEGVREVLRYLRGKDLVVCSRNTCRADVLRIYKREKKKVLTMLQRAPGKISFTSDCWTSITTEGYITLTAHFIDRDWKLQKRILNFSYLPPPHNGICLSQKLLSCLVDWGVDKKVMTFTLDSASSNESCGDLLIDNLKIRGMEFFNENYLRIRCCAHIINLVVQNGLKGDVMDPTVKKVRECVKYVRGSEARKKKFLECVVSCSLNARKGLTQDVPTRWNSTYSMLESALYFRRALTNLALSDSNFKSCCPSNNEWDIVEKLCKFLVVFYDLTVSFSGTKYPTANLYFPGVYDAYMTLQEAKHSEDEFLRTMAAPMYGKFEKYWGDFSEILAFAVVLDPRYKFSFVEWCFKTIYGESIGISKAMYLKHKLILFFEKYAAQASSSQSGSTSSNTLISSSSTSNALEELAAPTSSRRFMEFDSIEGDNIPQKSELEQYLDDKRIDRRTPLQVLDFWKTNQFRYPGVSAMARDVLSIPISTVASESAFSTGGRVLDQYRSSLLPQIVEALICSRDWLYGSGEEIKDEIDLCLNVMEVAVEHEDENNRASENED